jgi:hypothetical protein
LGLLVPLGLLAAVVGVLVVGVSRIPQVVAALQTPRLAVVGRGGAGRGWSGPGPRVRVEHRQYRGPWLVDLGPPPKLASPTLSDLTKVLATSS